MEFIVPYKESISLMWVLSLLGQNIGEGNGTPLQYSCLENPMGGGAWEAAVHGVAKSRTWLSDFTFTFHFHELEKDMATHSSVLAWRIPGTGAPGGLPSMGSHRVGHDWSDLAAAAAAGQNIPLRVSLVVQWLRLQLPMKGTWIQSLIGEDRTCCGATEPMCHNDWPSTATRETTAMRSPCTNTPI